MFKALEAEYAQQFRERHTRMQISPPKGPQEGVEGWTYGYVFYPELEYNEELNKSFVRLWMYRYDEIKDDQGRVGTERSQEIQSFLDPENRYTTTEQFLHNPLVDPPHFVDLNSLKKATGISDEQIQHTENLRAVIFPHLERFIQ